MQRGITRYLLIIGMSALAFPVRGEDLKGKIGLGLNFPGAQLNYGLTEKWLAEARTQFGSGIFLIGVRGYYRFPLANKKIIPYLGAQGDFISFKGEKTSGIGFGTLPFAGIEYFIIPRLSVSLDLGPYWSMLFGSGENVSGASLVINTGLTFYFK